jgi:hypothetical protein
LEEFHVWLLLSNVLSAALFFQGASMVGRVEDVWSLFNTGGRAFLGDCACILGDELELLLAKWD